MIIFFFNRTVKEIKKSIPKGVTLLAATKKQSVDRILESIDAGIEVIGENYVQEAEEKFLKKHYKKMPNNKNQRFLSISLLFNL